MPLPDHRPDFLPGDRNPPPERVVPEPTPAAPLAPPAPVKRYPLPLLILGAVLVVAILAGVFLVIRINLDDSGAPDPAAVPIGEPQMTLTPRTGTPAPLQMARPGQRVRVEGLYGNGSVMVTRAEWSDTGDLPPGQGRMYLNVELRYDVAEGSLFLHPNHYTAYDAAQTEYYPGIGSGKAQLPAQELKAGQSATGWVSIELPPGPTFFVITDEGINPLVMVEIPPP